MSWRVLFQHFAVRGARPERLQRRTACGGMVLLMLALTFSLGAGYQMQTTSSGEWQPTGLTEPVWRLFTPASGALFAHTARISGVRVGPLRLEWGSLLRSDDSGVSWRPVPLPTGSTGVVAIDPTDHSVLYGMGAEGLYKSEDDAANWRLIYRSGGYDLALIALSPADQRLIYLYRGRTWDLGQVLVRSRDGGATWEELPLSCRMVRLQPHPTDPRRVFDLGGCSARTLSVSIDQGEQWSQLFTSGAEGGIESLVGGWSAAPARFYLASHYAGRRLSPTQFGCCAVTGLYRSDNDGQTWTEKQTWSNASTWSSEQAVSHRGQRFGGLAYDPSEPDRVYVGLTYAGGGVKVSADGGSSWSDLGRQDLGEIHDLALGVDGRHLYAATDEGVYRLSLR